MSTDRQASKELEEKESEESEKSQKKSEFLTPEESARQQMIDPKNNPTI
jgi:hypothetical protein